LSAENAESLAVDNPHHVSAGCLRHL